MTTFVFANNISTQIASPVSSGDTTITLASVAGFPSSIPSGSVLEVTLNDQATHTVFEILYATAITGSTLTVLRAQEGTTALSWSTGDIVFSGPTAGQMQSFSSPNLAAHSLFGNPTASTAPAEAVTLGTSLAFSGTTLIAAPTTFNLTLDVTGSASLVGGTTVNLAATIGAGTVTTAKMAALAANTLIANPTGSSAVPQAVTLTNGLAFSGTALGMGNITPTSITTGIGTFTGITSVKQLNIVSSVSTATLFFSPNTGSGIGIVSTGTSLVFNNISAGTTAFFVNMTTSNASFSGSITCLTMNATSSDRRLKRDIRKFDARPLHRSVPFVSYIMKSNGWKGIGSIAQSVQDVAPEHVGNFEKDGKTYLSLNYAGMAYEQAMWASHEIDRQARIIAALEKRLAKLERKK